MITIAGGIVLAVLLLIGLFVIILWIFHLKAQFMDNHRKLSFDKERSLAEKFVIIGGREYFKYIYQNEIYLLRYDFDLNLLKVFTYSKSEDPIIIKEFPGLSLDESAVELQVWLKEKQKKAI